MGDGGIVGGDGQARWGWGLFGLGGLGNQGVFVHRAVTMTASVKVPALVTREKVWISKIFWLCNADGTHPSAGTQDSGLERIVRATSTISAITEDAVGSEPAPGP